MPHDERGPSRPETRFTVAGALVTIGALLLLIGWFSDEGAEDGDLPPAAGRWLAVLVLLLCALVASARHRELPGSTPVRRWVTTALAVSDLTAQLSEVSATGTQTAASSAPTQATAASRRTFHRRQRPSAGRVTPSSRPTMTATPPTTPSGATTPG